MGAAAESRNVQERPRGVLRVAGVGGKDLHTSLRVAGHDR
ncbi:hypothetical protein S1361_03895 [Streptomyces cyanogenus]|uniref:Uncharacterized protein n=1 Tax=Streptomyces cyanogenus TaxID=80860 RepID=A0ABX7TIR4_STRCY|nr:hypothetical protein S1361_03895 [Streptomyces cyanogenus]